MPGNIGVLVFKNIRPEINNLPILIQLPDFAVICHTDSKRCNIRRGRYLIRKQLHKLPVHALISKECATAKRRSFSIAFTDKSKASIFLNPCLARYNEFFPSPQPTSRTLPDLSSRFSIAVMDWFGWLPNVKTVSSLYVSSQNGTSNFGLLINMTNNIVGLHGPVMVSV